MDKIISDVVLKFFWVYKYSCGSVFSYIHNIGPFSLDLIQQNFYWASSVATALLWVVQEIIYTFFHEKTWSLTICAGMCLDGIRRIQSTQWISHFQGCNRSTLTSLTKFWISEFNPLVNHCKNVYKITFPLLFLFLYTFILISSCISFNAIALYML